MFNFPNHTARNGTPRKPRHVAVWVFSQRKATQQNNQIHASSSMFDTQKVGTLTNRVLTHTRHSKREYQNEESPRVGVTQTSTDIVDSAQLLIVKWHDIWFYSSTMFWLFSIFSEYAEPSGSKHIWQGLKIVVLNSGGGVFAQLEKHSAAYGSSVVHTEHDSCAYY